MRINPEIQRHFWLDFSMHRIVMMPVILLIIFTLVYLAAKNSSYYAAVSNSLAISALYMYCFLVFIWGNYRAVGSVLNDINDNTWDYQRLSSLSPLSLTLGTVMGSTLYVWYGAIICLMVFSFMSYPDYPPSLIFQSVIILLVSGLASIAAMTLVGMQSLQSAHRSKRHRLMGYRIIAIIAGILLMQATTALLVTKSPGADSFLSAPLEKIILFYGNALTAYNFYLMTILILLAWALFGVYRSMRTELKMRTSPLGWTAFLLFMVFYFGDLSFPSEDIIARNLPFTENTSLAKQARFFAVGFAISLLSFYLMFFSDYLSATRYRMMFHHFATQNNRRGFELIPRWVVSLLFAFITGIGIILTAGSNSEPVGLMTISILLFMLRDIAILNFFSLAADNRRALGATVFYLAVLYWLLPMVFAAAKLTTPGLFYPAYDIRSAANLVPIIVQLVIVSVLVAYRWNQTGIVTQQTSTESVL